MKAALLLIYPTLLLSAYADTLPNLDDNTKIALPIAPKQSIKTQNITNIYNHIDTSNDDIEHRLGQAILQKDDRVIQQLLSQYQELPNADKIMVQYAQAVLYEKRLQLKQAIRIYRKILSDNPSLNAIRFELAKVLFDDKQMIAAKSQFEKVKSENPPELVQKLSDLYLNAIQKQSQIQINLSLSYLNDNNINNANHAPFIGDTPFKKSQQMFPQSATGVSFGLDIQKDFNLSGNHYVRAENDLISKYYWDNQDYNDIINRTSLGYLYQNDQNRWAVLPFYEKRSYANQSYKSSYGVRGEYTHWLSSSHQLSTALEYTKNNYDDYHQLNGNSRLLSATYLWLVNAKRYVYFGADVSQENTQEKNQTYHYQAMRMGVGQEWGKGVSSRIGVNFGKRQYQDKAVIGGIIPLDVVRKDDEFLLNIALWKRDWYFFGVTPRINYQYKKTNSNIPSMYSTQKNQVFISFEKSF